MIHRYAAGPLAPEKLNEILLKIRKGATSLTLAQIQAVVQHLGGSMVPTVSVVPVDEEFISVEKSKADETFARLNKYKVSSVPSNPKPKSLFITELPPFTRDKYQPDQAVMEGIKAYMAVRGLTVSLNGKTEVINGSPSSYLLGDIAYRGKKPDASNPYASDVIEWLIREANLVSLVNANLSMEAHVPAAQRTRENTGHCAVCLQNVKLKPGRIPTIVLHGYRRPGSGSISPACFGTGYPPYELSDKGTKAFIEKELEPTIKKVSEKIQNLKSGTVTSLVIQIGQRKQEVTPTDPYWARYVSQEIQKTEAQLYFFNKELDEAKVLVSKWKIRPLPVEGGPPFRFAAMASRVASRYMAK